MNIKEVVATAKSHIVDLFGEEGIANIGLEEIVPDPNFADSEDERVWHITIGFSRQWDAQGAFGIAAGLPRNRVYKIVDILDSDGRVLSVRNREMANH
jgi:hypothetical protein